ncbi:hypothetical protein COY07_00120 [Candidatus Peregrinibacteria bacterium CG_4_10_14_0_2_um_filter_43_11]|nr:MAG: hypothetical protein COY07_00120 [Candidatus Peregrinibacteria bacterium CG_4_10_14_0_2_um_filter_43_11]
MKINITKKQYALLIKMLYLGDWMINAIKLPDDRNREVDEFFSYILSFAKEFGMEDMTDEDEGEFSASRELDEDDLVQESMEAYNEETFWDELIDRLAERDFHRKYSTAEIRAMKDWIERAGHTDEFRDKYAEEFEKNGLDRLEIADGK